MMKKEPNGFAEIKQQLSKMMLDEVTRILKAIGKYKEDMANNLAYTINNKMIENCKASFPTYKFLCNTVIYNKSGIGGLYISNLTYWDESIDGTIMKKFDFEQIRICVSIYAIF